MINNVTLTGRITKDLEKKETGKGTSVVNFSLAVDRRFKDSNGNREADFIGIQAWGMTADLLCKYCGKGSLIGIEGRIQTRNYENNQGQRVYVTEVVAESLILRRRTTIKANKAVINLTAIRTIAINKRSTALCRLTTAPMMFRSNAKR